MWLQFDWGEGPRIGGRRTQLFCAWLAWSRFRVVIPAWDQTLGTLVACLDADAAPDRRGADVSADRQREDGHRRARRRDPGAASRDGRGRPALRLQGRDLCAPFDPESKGGVEATVQIAKADLVPTSANLRADYATFAELVAACERWCEQVNARVHRETGARHRSTGSASSGPPARAARRAAHPGAGRGTAGQRRPDDPLGSVRYSTPPGHVGSQRCGAGSSARNWSSSPATDTGLAEIAATSCPRRATRDRRRALSRTTPAADTSTAPRPRPRTEAEAAFLDSVRAPHRWLVEAAAAGAGRVRAKMARAVELAAVLVGAERGRPGARAWPRSPAGSPRTTWPRSWTTSPPHGDAERPGAGADETHSAQPGTGGGRGSAPVNTSATPRPRPRARSSAAARRAGHAAAPDAAALPARRRPRRARHRPRPTLGPRRSAAGAARRGGHRPRRRHPPACAARPPSFPAGKTFAVLAARATPPSPTPTQHALATLEWIGRAENLAVAGPSGTGKSHFVEALAHAAIDAGPAGRLVHPRIAHHHHRPGQGRRLHRPHRRPDLPRAT